MSEEYNALENTISSISHGIDLILGKSHEKRHATKGNFNLFTVLRKVHDEAGLHSRFLHFLLDPKESHDCNRLFLDLFIEMLSKKYPEYKFAEFKEAKCVGTCTEKATNQGRRIDIYLEFEGSRVIAIEQKIWFHESDMQISDYADFIKSDNESCYLFFLTLDGRKSGTANGKHYLTLSYRDDIMNFIDTCLQATYMYVNINQALQQYKKVIAELTDQVEENDMREIKELIKKNKSLIIHQKLFNQAIQKIKTDLFDDFRAKLEKKLEETEFHLEIREGKKDINGEIKNKSNLPIAIWGVADKSFLMIGISLRLVDNERKELLSTAGTEIKEKANRLLQAYHGGITKEWIMGTYHIFTPEFQKDLITNVDSKTKTDIEINARVGKVIDYLFELKKEWNELTIGLTGLNN